MSMISALLTSSGGQIPLGLPHVLPGGPDRLDRVPAQMAAQLADSLSGSREPLLQVVIHMYILLESHDTRRPHRASAGPNGSAASADDEMSSRQKSKVRSWYHQ